jgi:3-methyladenine DNA glycosylase AlkC
MEPLKNMYGKVFINDLARMISKKYSKFDSSRFNKLVFTKEWKNRELKDRMRHITLSLNELLPFSFKKSIKILECVSIDIQKSGFELMILPDFVEVFGVDDWDESIRALEKFTSLASSEFAVRPLIIKDSKKMMKIMLAWSKHKNYHVRRLSTEGCRPRLPWAMALPEFKNDPTPILPILERLKDDPQLYVRRSVANNLNDISKDNPDVVLSLTKKWFGQKEEVDWVIKHGLRTLLKQAHPKALAMFGHGNSNNLKVENLILTEKNIKIGGELSFSFNLLSRGKGNKIRLEYVIYYLKKNGSQSRKVFKITERFIEDKVSTFSKKQSFKEMSTRKHHPGKHKIAIIVNGKEFNCVEFNVEKS